MKMEDSTYSMTHQFTVMIFGALTSLLLLGCAGPKPVLYPNDHFETVGHEQAELDIAECRNLADAHTSSSNKGMEVAQGTAVGAGVGAAWISRKRSCYWGGGRSHRRASAISSSKIRTKPDLQKFCEHLPKRTRL